MTQSRFHTRRRLLFLLPFAPRLDATHGGGRVMAQLITNLAPGHDVAILCLRALDEPPVDQALRERCTLVEEVTRPWSGCSPVQRMIRNGRLMASLVHLRPMWVTDWASQAYRDRVRSLVQTWRPDIVQIEFHIMGQYLSALDGCAAPRVLTEHELGIHAAPYLKRLQLSLGRLAHQLDRLAWRQYEPAVIRRVQAVVVFTEREQKAIEQLGLKTPVQKIPFGTVVPDRALDPLGRTPLSLLFIGSFIHPPNVDAAIRLARAIFPLVQRCFPELELYIVGDQPPPELRQMASAKVMVTGRVPDLVPYLDRAAVFVAPLCSGGGMRVKVLEALAAGKAVVATPLAAEGVDLVDGEQISLADSNRELAERIIRLLADSERRTSLAASARAWACANLTWKKSIEAYEALYDRLLMKSEA